MDFILSDGNNINSKGYRINLTGINLDRFNANPVMLYEHNPDNVIGRWENVRIENNRLIASPVFDKEDVLGKEICRKVENNFLRGASIGIIPVKLGFIDDEYVMEQCEQVEASIVSIPADSGAVKLYNEKLEELSFDQVKTNFNFNNTNQFTKMAETVLKLSQKTVESLNLTADYTPKDVELAVAEKDREIEKLKADLKANRKQTQTDYLNAAVKAGKISETERLAFEKMADKGVFEDVKAMIDAKAETPTATLSGMVQKTNQTAGRETWDYLKWMKEDPKGLSKIKAENPKEFERLQLTLNS